VWDVVFNQRTYGQKVFTPRNDEPWTKAGFGRVSPAEVYQSKARGNNSLGQRSFYVDVDGNGGNVTDGRFVLWPNGCVGCECKAGWATPLTKIRSHTV
jgi:hypothetical protein